MSEMRHDRVRDFLSLLGPSTTRTPGGEPVTDADFCIIFNAHHEPLEFILPGPESGNRWLKKTDTTVGFVEEGSALEAGQQPEIEARSVVVLRHVP